MPVYVTRRSLVRQIWSPRTSILLSGLGRAIYIPDVALPILAAVVLLPAWGAEVTPFTVGEITADRADYCGSAETTEISSGCRVDTCGLSSVVTFLVCQGEGKRDRLLGENCWKDASEENALEAEIRRLFECIPRRRVFQTADPPGGMQFIRMDWLTTGQAGVLGLDSGFFAPVIPAMDTPSVRRLALARSFAYADGEMRNNTEESRPLADASRKLFRYSCHSSRVSSIPAKTMRRMRWDGGGSRDDFDNAVQPRVLQVREGHQGDGSRGPQHPWRQPAQLNPDDDDNDDHFGFRRAHFACDGRLRDYVCLRNCWSGYRGGGGGGGGICSRQAKSPSVSASTIATWRAAIQRTCMRSSSMRRANDPYLATNCPPDSCAWGRGQLVLCRS
ncbi:hypothetical protein CLCR_10358 [Cladophialophora carrionii]|uniref:Uncharacterized protein n=1 Tax=Cladophialophora carrionii TaxID=86049 RepID=A0A1C1CX21_9EURO|nr:hypothetical protein CLCR_10358 [Cladophialophora carrionii]